MHHPAHHDNQLLQQLAYARRWPPCKSKIYWAKPLPVKCPERIGNIRVGSARYRRISRTRRRARIWWRSSTKFVWREAEGTARTYLIGIAAPSYVRVVLLIEKRKIDGLGHCLIADVIGMHVIAAVIGG